jgi:hypothetical protein
MTKTSLPYNWMAFSLAERLSRAAGTTKADAKHAHNIAKAYTKVVAARIRRDIRAHPDQYGFGTKKPTIDEVDDALQVHEVYRKAVEDENRAEYAFDIASTNVVAVCHDRRKALESMIELLRLDYLSEREYRPKTPEAREKLSQDRRRSARQGIEDEDFYPADTEEEK